MAIVGIAAGVSLVSNVLGFSSSSKARRAARRAEALRAKRAAIANVQNRRAAAAAIRRQQAQQAAGAIANGMGGGSGDLGTRGSVQSQGLASMAYAQQQVDLGGEANAATAEANKYNTQAGNYQAIGSLAGQIGAVAQTFQTPVAPEVPGLPATTP